MWGGLSTLLLVAVALGLGASQELALQHWYLLAAPPIVAAFFFGFRGALAMSGLSIVALLTLLPISDLRFSQMTQFAQTVATVAIDPREASALASQVADMLASGPQTIYGRALTGMGFIVLCSMLLGLSVDRRIHSTLVLHRAAAQFRRYMSPKIVEAIVEKEGEVDLESFSARKEVTLLFGDLRGFTTLSERMEAEDVVLLLNEFFDAMTDEVLKHGGTLDKYIGDEIMAFFGDNEESDHPERAVECAIAMQQRMRELNQRWRGEGRETAQVGIGISTGIGIIGNIGSSHHTQYTAVGSTVNVASRLADLAKPGQILTTRKTYFRVQHVIGGLPLEPVTVKGFPNPVEVVEILGNRMVAQQHALPVNDRWSEVVARVVNDPSYRATLLRALEQAAATFPLNSAEQALARQVAVLSGYPLFQKIPASEMATLMSFSTVEQRNEGEAVVMQGGIDQRFFIVLQGEVVVTVTDDERQERHVATLSKGDSFGEAALLFDTPRTATVRASAPSAFLVLHRDGFYDLMEQSPVLRQRIEGIARSRASQPAEV